MDKKLATGRPLAGASKAPKRNSSVSNEKHLGVEVGSVVIFVFALFALVALATYSPQDPSFFTSTHGAIQNACGRVGAYLAAVFFQCVGIASFLVPAALFFLSAVIFKREGSLKVVGTLSGMTVAVLALTVFLTLQWKYWPYAGTLLLTGGAFGVWFAQVLMHEFNSVGASLVSLSVFLLSLALSTPVSVATLGSRVISAASRVGLKVLKVAVTYISFLLGLAAMKTAQAAARGLENAIEAAIRQAKDMNEKRKAAAAAKPAIGDEKPFSKTNTMVFGSDEKVQASADKAAEKKAAAETEKLEKAGARGMLAHSSPLSTAQEARISLGGGAFSDAENILASDRLPADTGEGTLKTDSVPAILPHEHQKQHDLGVVAANPAPAKEKKARLPSKRGTWKLPKIDFMVKAPEVKSDVNKDRLYQNAEILRQKFIDFEIEGEVTAIRPGPVITLYEFKPAAGIKVSRIAALADDISMALSAQTVRIIAPLPGKSVVGIEVPSETRENVFMREFLSHTDFQGQKYALPIAMGKDIAGNTYFNDLSRMPHILCAGQTGSGKSVFMNGLICSLLYRFTPDELRMILVDPKMIEFASYQDIPHLLLPVVDDSSQAASALKWAVREMERRYRVLAMSNVRNLASFNQRVDEIGVELLQENLEMAESQIEGMEKLSGGDWQEVFEKDEDGNPAYGKLPYIVIVIDELADLMMTARKEVEISIARIAQKARAAGIHMVIATQRPSTDVVTGVIKANLPSRVSFQLASGVDSKTILDRVGAERLLGRGDMFFIPPGTSNLLRLHGAYLSDDEINKVTQFLRDQGKPSYRNEILDDEDAEGGEGFEGEEDVDDPMFQRAVELIKQSGTASASYLQRHLRVGYNRAARMIETMEMRGIVGPADGARPREVLIRRDTL